MKITKAMDGKLLFYCEGCGCHHGVTKSWQFNESFERPTFSPSILVKSTKLTDKGLADLEEWEKKVIRVEMVSLLIVYLQFVIHLLGAERFNT